jgi:membrane protease YdiL (CAAX protease family)
VTTVSLARRLETALRHALAPVDAGYAVEPADTPAGLRRRRVVTAAVTLLGAVLLGWSLSVEPGSTAFYVASLVLAAVWALGALASGPLHLGRIGPTSPGIRPIVPAIALGVALAGLFVIGGLVVREVPVLEDAVNSVLAYARQGAGPLVLTVTVVNAIAEEMFFRGALFAAVPRRAAVLVTTAVYTLASLTSGNAVLAFAALLLGLLTALERRASGGVLAPILTHVTWSLLMLLALPPLFG